MVEGSDDEYFAVSIERPNTKIKEFLLYVFSIAFWSGVVIGFICCLSMNGLGLYLIKLVEQYPSLLNFFKIFWLNLDWKVWVAIFTVTVMFGVVVSWYLKRKIANINV
ncbi:MAG TPA: hypothetical protein VJ201_07225 [Candidatus Babeliales bacterium]|nr:hypothetical protein [Candidatus Babeliales bacterium]